tara:strand:- start:783 stop:1169 length:387 start_codon:yes stop_codon:yes gene_type:complete
MKVRHRNITNTTSAIIIISADRHKKNNRIVKSLLISNTYAAASTVSVYLRALNIGKTEKQKILGSSPGQYPERYDESFYVVKRLSIPKETSVDVFSGFSEGFIFEKKYELVIELGDNTHAVSTIVVYE